MDEFDVDDLEFIPRPDLIGYECKCPKCGFFIRALAVVEVRPSEALQLEFDCPVCRSDFCLATDALPDHCKEEFGAPLEVQIRFPDARWH